MGLFTQECICKECKLSWIRPIEFFHLFIKSIYKPFTCIVTEMKIEQQKLMHWHNIEYLHTSKIKEMLFLDDDLNISQHEIDVCLWWRFDRVFQRTNHQPCPTPSERQRGHLSSGSRAVLPPIYTGIFTPVVLCLASDSLVPFLLSPLFPLMSKTLRLAQLYRPSVKKGLRRTQLPLIGKLMCLCAPLGDMTHRAC